MFSATTLAFSCRMIESVYIRCSTARWPLDGRCAVSAAAATLMSIISSSSPLSRSQTEGIMMTLSSSVLECKCSSKTCSNKRLSSLVWSNFKENWWTAESDPWPFQMAHTFCTIREDWLFGSRKNNWVWRNETVYFSICCRETQVCASRGACEKD